MLRLTPGIAASPSDKALTGLEKTTHVSEKPHCPNQGERPDVGVRKRFVESSGGGQDRAALGYHVVDQHNSLWCITGRCGAT
jgi:hypothetical protein